ncbi:MAG: GNAT family N-acetyltransferase [Nocardioidaceae bacterium]|nr:GNAT family N-acetyltransferase [Nocardioidaceae bacterium]NUS51028.1 GNAT family N-acetyltransferase [Nocardioidaceae bacterium]
MGADELVVRPLTADTWDAFAAMVERHNGIFGGCWCIWFHPDCAERGQGYDGNRALKRKLVEQGEAHAALVFDGDRAVAWCEYGTPEELPNIHHRKQYDAERDLLPDYRLTCIFIDKEYRRRGLSEIALQGALDLIAAAGGGVVEGYPQDLSDGRRVGNSFLYNGTRALYERAGFDYQRAKGKNHTVMRRTVAPA